MGSGGNEPCLAPQSNGWEKSYNKNITIYYNRNYDLSNYPRKNIWRLVSLFYSQPYFTLLMSKQTFNWDFFMVNKKPLWDAFK